MKKQNTSKAKSSAVREAETAWPLLQAYIDLAERHCALLTERLEATLARAKAEREARVAADVRSIMQDVEAALDAMPPAKLF